MAGTSIVTPPPNFLDEGVVQDPARQQAHINIAATEYLVNLFNDIRALEDRLVVAENTISAHEARLDVIGTIGDIAEPGAIGATFSQAEVEALRTALLSIRTIASASKA